MDVARYCYRYRTSALIGPWYPTEEQAVSSAFDAGQATRLQGDLILLSITKIEKRPYPECQSECGF